jgi:hypothetical protein
MLVFKCKQYRITVPVGLWACRILVEAFIHLDALYKELSTYGLYVGESTSTITIEVILSDTQAITIPEASAEGPVELSQIQQSARSYTIWHA